MANYVGLDLGSHQVRILEAEGSARRLKIKRFTKVDLRPAQEGPISNYLTKDDGDAIDDGFSDAKISHEPVAMSWDSAHTVFRELDVPFTSDDQIRKVIKYETESHLLNCDIEDVIVSFYRLSETRDKSHLMVMAVRKDQLLNRFEMLQRANLDPLMVDLDVMAAFNAITGLGYAEEHKTFMVLDCGRRSSNLLLIHKGRLVSGRAIRLGSDSVTARLAADLGPDAPELAAGPQALLQGPNAGDLMVRASTADAKPETAKASDELALDMAQERASDYYLKIAREVKRTLATTKLPDEIEVILAAGPGSLLPGFTEMLAQQLGLEAPVEPLNVLERVDHDLDADEADAVGAESLVGIGLVLKLAGHDASGVDFRQEECRYARKFDQIKEPLIYFCGFLLFLVLLWNLLDVRMLSVKEPFLFKKDQADIARIHKWGKEKYERALGKDATLPGARAAPTLNSLRYIQAQMTSHIDKLKGDLGRGGAIPEMQSALVMWRDCFDEINKKIDSIGKLILTDMKIGVRQQKNPFIQLEGEVPSDAALDTLRAALRQVPGQSVADFQDGRSRNLGGRIAFSDIKIVWPAREDYK